MRLLKDLLVEVQPFAGLELSTKPKIKVLIFSLYSFDISFHISSNWSLTTFPENVFSSSISIEEKLQTLSFALEQV